MRRFVTEGLGGRMRREFFGPPTSHATYVGPGLDEDIFEWIALLEAILVAQGRFRMMELGCGFGRWLVIAAMACKQRGNFPLKLIGVEAEPAYHRWACRHFRDNGLNLSEHELIHAAVGPKDGTAKFYTGSIGEWYGQARAPDDLPATSIFERFLRRVRRQKSKPMDTVTAVPMISLNTLLRHQEWVDLIDMDVQGAEGGVLTAADDQLDRKVCKVHIGTHSHEVEEELRHFFEQRGWHNLIDYPCLSSSETPYGRIQFQDGVQTWINPRLRQI
jgi:FkbM family methyltransferase